MKIRGLVEILVFCAIFSLPILGYVISHAGGVVADVPGGGGGGGIYTEEWSTTTATTNSTAQPAAQTTSKTNPEIGLVVRGEDVFIAVLIGGVSIFIGKLTNALQRPKGGPIVLDRVPEGQILLASSKIDISEYMEEAHERLGTAEKVQERVVRDIQSKIDKLKKDGFTKMYGRRQNEFNKIRRSPHFEDAIDLLRKEGWKAEDITLEEIKDTVGRIKEKQDKLKGRKTCRNCYKPVKAIQVRKEEDPHLGKWYRHKTRSGRSHEWYVPKKRDRTAYDDWRIQNGLHTKWTYCKCAYCFTWHNRKYLKLNPWYNRVFRGPKFQCKQPTCSKWQNVPRVGQEYEDGFVVTFERE